MDVYMIALATKGAFRNKGFGYIMLIITCLIFIFRKF